jgi:transcription antitermination factor NusG
MGRGGRPVRGTISAMDILFQTEDRVRITEGTFKGFAGTVDRIDAAAGLLSAMIQVPGARGPVPVELRFNQIELERAPRPPAQT